MALARNTFPIVEEKQKPIVVFGCGKTEASILNEYADQTQSNPILYKQNGYGGAGDYYYEIDGEVFPSSWAANKKEGKQTAATSAVAELIADRRLVVRRDGKLDETDLTEQMDYDDDLNTDLEDFYYSYLSMIANNFAEDKVFKSISAIETPKVFACIIEMNSGTNAIRVVSWASGNKCIDSINIKNDGSALFDCHAEILARRGWMRFIYDQLITTPGTRFIQGEQQEDPRKVLKKEFSYHLIISEAPCGDAAVFIQQMSKESLANEKNSSEEPRLKHRPLAMTRDAQGVLRVKLENGDGTVPSDTAADASRLRTMSCSDKILKWNVLGLQGSLLSQLIQPIFLQSIHVGGVFHHAHLVRALCCRAQKLKLVHSNVHHPVLVEHSCDEKSGSDTFAYAWNIVDESFEKINPRDGMLDEYPIENSKLCKSQFYDAFLSLSSNIRTNSYLEAKAQAVQYKKAQNEFENACKFKAGYRGWIHKNPNVNNF